MKKKEYEKLVLDSTTINTKAKLFHAELVETTTGCHQQFILAEDKLKNLAELILKIQQTPAMEETERNISGVTIKKSLTYLEKDIKTNMELVLNKANKQLDHLREILQKTVSQLQPFLSTTQEFDLTIIQGLLADSKKTLELCEQQIQIGFKELSLLKNKITHLTTEDTVLFLDQELEDLTQKTSQLTHKLSTIQQGLAEHLEILRKSNQFLPICTAFKQLKNQAKLLDLVDSDSDTETAVPLAADTANAVINSLQLK